LSHMGEPTAIHVRSDLCTYMSTCAVRPHLTAPALYDARESSNRPYTQQELGQRCRAARHACSSSTAMWMESSSSPAASSGHAVRRKARSQQPRSSTSPSAHNAIERQDGEMKAWRAAAREPRGTLGHRMAQGSGGCAQQSVAAARGVRALGV
jgi:hypothetical protein